MWTQARSGRWEGGGATQAAKPAVADKNGGMTHSYFHLIVSTAKRRRTDAMFSMSMNAKCSCGAFVIWEEATTNETPVFCEGCGQTLGTFGELRCRVSQIATDRIERLFGRSGLSG
jgi:hypothetical protein